MQCVGDRNMTMDTAFHVQDGWKVNLKRSRTAASLAPMYLFSTSGPFTLMQRKPQAATAADTRCVLPHPGGPYNSIPVRSRSGALHSQAEDW